MIPNRRTFLHLMGASALSSALLSVVVPARAWAQGSETLTIAQSNDILSLDPANHGNNSTESALINIYDYLVRKEFVEGETQFQPNLARSWQTDDMVHWIFELRDDVVWHDGTPFTAEDVKFTVERTQGDTSLRNSSKFSTIETVNVLDPHRVEIVTKGRDPILLHSLVGNGALILPRQAFEAAADAETFFAKPIGTGAYRFVEWRRGDRLILEANPDWWGGKAHWDRVVVRGIPETATRVAELLTGGADVAVNIPPDDIDRVKNNPGSTLAAFDIARNFALHVRNEEGTSTHDPRVREAIDLAINREEITKFILEDYATPTRGLFPPEIPGYNPDLNADNSFDPDRARQLIKDAGAEGVKITLNSPSGRWSKDREVAEAIVGYLQDVGLDAQLEVLEWSVLNSRLQSDTLGEVYLWAMGSYTDGSQLLNLGTFKRFNPHWSNAEFVTLSQEMGNAPTEDDRRAILRRAQVLVTDDRVRIGVLYPKAIYGISARVVFPGRFDEMIPAEQVRRA
ncbi:ABC transporter substrate-binding protein [Sinirhodobacter populi]|uniref:ABC transporter substrate-binding protein n=1 Tax=Paenirhodobacter populi TaxID=2306993 RepID=A0A443K4T8_9RHOB|nr:ABC transporter substrate-binding protein [Sinirhodobacter populi]RWR27713.1 ABC transporter substrate-binding protein [Sinirhodobacter populi]